MKRRVCSYDMFAVPDPSFVLKDTVGEMYFSNLRCFWMCCDFQSCRLEM
jgi:hypothetical protein